MSTLNPFDILGADDIEDPSQLIAAAAAEAQKAEAKKAAAAPAGKAAQPAAAAKFPTKPAPPSQAVKEARGGGGAPQRGGFGRGRGGRGYGQNRDFGGDNTNDFQFQGGYGGGGAGDGAVTGGSEGDRERGPRPPFRGGGRRGGYRIGEFGDDSERPPRRNYERRSGTGRGYEMKRDGAGRGNWGAATDEVLAQEIEEGLKVEEAVPVAEKQGEQNDAPTADENKDNKDATANVEEEKEEDKEMTLEEFEKIMEEKRKALLALKAEERKVEVDKDLQSMQLLATKKANDEVFIKLGSDKDKKKESAAERDERAKKSLSINEFLKPAEGERYYGGRGRGRGRGERGGFRGGYSRGAAAIPSIEDQAQFPTLGAK